MRVDQLRTYVIEPVLRDLGLYSASARELLVMTAAAESAGGDYLHQVGGGPACGIFQMEPATHDDIWTNFLRYRSGGAFQSVERYLASVGAGDRSTLAARVAGWQVPGAFRGDDAREMCGNLYYATAMARMHYLRVPQSLPASNDVNGLAEYHKTHYNTELGASEVAKTVNAYRRYIA